MHFSGSVEVDGMNIMFPCNVVHAGKRGRLQQKTEEDLLWDSQELPLRVLALRQEEIGLGRVSEKGRDHLWEKCWGDAVYSPS